MNNFFSKLANFMQGRYGNDNLNIALGVVWLIINIINTVFIRIFWVNMIIHLILILIFALILFRTLSRNISKRTRENETFLYYYNRTKPFRDKIKPFCQKVVAWFKLQLRKIEDRKTHRYIKCPYCKAVIRVPFRKGKHTVNCPRCTVDFKTNIRF